MRNEIIKHLRKSTSKCCKCQKKKERGVPYATFVGVKKNGKVRIGFSKAHTRLDPMCKKEGVRHARDRAVNGFSYGCWTIPHEIIKNLPDFVNRCQKYFKVNDEDFVIFPYEERSAGRINIKEIK